MSVSSTLPPVRLNNQVYQKVTATVDARSGGPRSHRGIKTSGRCQPVINTPSRVVAATGDHFHWSRGLRRTEINRRPARRRRVGGGRRFARPDPPCLRLVVRLLRTRPPKLSPQGVVTVGHCKFVLQLSDDPNVGRSQVSTMAHQDTPNLRLPAASPLFGGE